MNTITLIENTKLAEYDCAWCSAVKGVDVHSRACPVGERYWQVQKLGGVPYPKAKLPSAVAIDCADEATHCLECGKVVEEHTLACDDCLAAMSIKAA